MLNFAHLDRQVLASSMLSKTPWLIKKFSWTLKQAGDRWSAIARELVSTILQVYLHRQCWRIPDAKQGPLNDGPEGTMSKWQGRKPPIPSLKTLNS